MRPIGGSRFVSLLAIALVAIAQVALASEAQRAVDEASAALATLPPQRDAARRALDRATATDDDPAAVSEAYFLLGALDEQEAAFAQAISHYRRSQDAKPPGARVRWPRNAANRVAWLSARAEGNFAPLARLYRFTRAPALATDPDEIDALDRDTDAFPPGIVRAESRVLIATAWLGPLHRPRDAIRLFRMVATDPTADGLNRRFAERGFVDAPIAEGQLDEAAREAQAHAVQLDPEVVIRLHRVLRRRGLLRVAGVELAVFLVLAAACAYLRRKRRAARAARRSIWIMARIAAGLGAIVSLIALVFVLLGVFAPNYLERIGL